MKSKFILKDNFAVAGAIEFILIIGLIAILLSTIQLIYVPEIMEQKEADHMDEISNQFSRLKAMIDIQSKEKTNIPISNIVTLGSKELPYFVTLPKSGTISIIDKDETESEIRISNESSYETFELTSIKYQANNLYFVPQSYIYEAGGIIIKQPEGQSIMWLEPSLNVTPIKNQNGYVTDIDIYFDVPVIFCEYGDSNIGGLDNYYVQTNYSVELSDDDWNFWSNILSINISTEYPNAWFEFFQSLDKDVKNNVTISKGLDYVTLEKTSKTINLYYRKSCIFAYVEQGG